MSERIKQTYDHDDTPTEPIEIIDSDNWQPTPEDVVYSADGTAFDRQEVADAYGESGGLYQDGYGPGARMYETPVSEDDEISPLVGAARVTTAAGSIAIASGSIAGAVNPELASRTFEVVADRGPIVAALGAAALGTAAGYSLLKRRRENRERKRAAEGYGPSAR